VAAVDSAAVVRPGAGDVNIARLFRHALTFNWQTRRRFPPTALAAIEAEITAGEKLHSGEVRVFIETALEAPALWRNCTPRQRALDLFGRHGLWDTELNNAVLIYILMADRDVEILADRGFNQRVSGAEWEAICRQMEDEFRLGRFESGVVAGVRAVSALVGRHFPFRADDRNELPDVPLIL
jgi:uncharacterized membrane protein